MFVNNNFVIFIFFMCFLIVFSGAAHGLSSILLSLLCIPEFLKANPSAEADVRAAVDFMLSLEQPNWNYAPAMDEVNMGLKRPVSEELVHWCHGAPGKIFPESPLRNVFRNSLSFWRFLLLSLIF